MTKLNATGASLLYSTFIGGLAWDTGRGIVIDDTGNAFITGYTDSSAPGDFPTIPGVFDTTYNGGW